MDAFKIAGILIFGKLIGNLSIGSGTLILVSGKEALHFKITVFAFIFNLTLNFILIKEMGVIGAAYATMSTYLLINFIKYYIGNNLLKINNQNA